MPEAADEASAGDDLAWFTGVVREHSTALVRYFARRGPRQDAEDLAADVFATAWRRRADVPREAVLPWLYRTAGFTLANHRRKGRPCPEGPAGMIGERDAGPRGEGHPGQRTPVKPAGGTSPFHRR